MLAVSSYDTVTLYDVRFGAMLLNFESLSHIRAVAFSPDAMTLALAWSDGKTKLWIAKFIAISRTSEGDLKSITSLIFSLDGKLLASSSSDRMIMPWIAESGAALLVLNIHSGWRSATAFS